MENLLLWMQILIIYDSSVESIRLPENTAELNIIMLHFFCHKLSPVRKVKFESTYL